MATETKIVKATPKKTESQHDEQPRVTVKAAVKPQVRNQNKPTRTQAAEPVKTSQRPPMGKPVVNKELEGRTRMPIGKPVVPKEVAERGKEAVVEEAPKAVAPKVEEHKAEAKFEAPKTE